MDEFSKLQQINTVARELMKHGQASTMDEAMRKARQQIDSGVAVMPVQQIEVPEMPQMQSFSHEGGADSDVLRKVEAIVAQQQSVISSVVNSVNANAQTIASLNAKMNSLIADLAELKAKVDRLAESPITPAPMRKKDSEEGQTQFKQEPKPMQAQPSSPPAGEQRNHARTGNFKPDDVSIEKFFYFGPGGSKK